MSVDIRQFPWIRRLAADYAFAYDRVAPFFAGDPASPDAWAAAIARAQQLQRDHAAVAALLGEQQRRRGAPPEALAASQTLADPQAVAVVTGQQAGVFGGPLFTLLKALSAIKTARAVSAQHRVPVVPVFWIEGEDHDWPEVRSCAVFDADLGVHHVTLADLAGAGELPVARLKLDHHVGDAIQALAAALPPTEFTHALLEDIKAAYQPGHDVADAFGRWLERVLGPLGLVVYDASDPAAKPLVRELFTREITEGRAVQLAADAGESLQAAGYHAQVAPHDGSLALFHLDGRRTPIRRDGDRFVIGDEGAWTRGDLLQQVREHPEHFSPNVLLRPLVQDTVFPTIAYVAGPNELAYLGQLKGVYAHFGVPMPLMLQRLTATLVDSNAMRFLTKTGMPLAALRPQDELALNQLLESQLPPSVEHSLEDVVSVVQQRMDALAAAVPQIDPTLEGATRSTLGKMHHELRTLHGKIIQAAKRRDETLRRQFRHAQALAFPGGHPQEREIGFVYFLNRYGPALLDRLLEELPTEMGHHWIVTV